MAVSICLDVLSHSMGISSVQTLMMVHLGLECYKKQSQTWQL